MRKHLLLTAVFGVGVLSLPASALEEISEEDLQEVTAKGVQVIINNDDPDEVQNNNNDSVQLNDQAQKDILAFSVMNISNSAANQSANLALADGTAEDVDIHQDTFQVADNYVDLSLQVVFNDDDPDAIQNNNNASVQIRGDAQQNAVSFHNLNAANSAVNQAAQAAAVFDTGEDVRVDQDTVQIAINDTAAGQAVVNDGPSADLADAPQNNNNTSVQINDEGQQNVVAFTLANIAGAAVNQASNLTLVSNTGEDVDVDQAVTQFASNFIVSGQLTVDNEDIDGIQNNNNASVQLNANAQQNAVMFQGMNASSSAANQAANLTGVFSTGGDVDIYQSSNQTAVNTSF
ncbi:MAG: hypothetical protein Q9N26_01210 [Aquificota bacterium]|nr:hypothetical protein [Aquificota bacterium]